MYGLEWLRMKGFFGGCLGCSAGMAWNGDLQEGVTLCLSWGVWVSPLRFEPWLERVIMRLAMCHMQYFPDPSENESE